MMIDPVEILKRYDLWRYKKDAEGHEHDPANGQFTGGGSGRAPDLDKVQELGDVADESLSHKAEQAISSFVGHGKKSRGKESFESMGIWSPELLERTFAGDSKHSEVRGELEHKFKPVREQLRKLYGDRITLHRTEKIEPGAGSRSLLSWTANKKFAESLAGVHGVKPLTDERIADAIRELDNTGETKVGGRIYRRRGDEIDFIKPADDYGGEEHITSYDREDIPGELKDQQEYRAQLIEESNEAAKSIITRDIDLNDVIWMTDRANQKEFIVKNKPSGE